MTVTEKGFAKINLFLDVVAKRPDGYHNIESIMHTVNLWDEITVTESGETKISCTNPSVPTDERNLAYKALNEFSKELGKKINVKIHIEKNIPVAAGLAGGSTDCAAVLKALNRLYGTPFSTEKLEEIGGRLGADVPFCIRGGTWGMTGTGFDFLEVAPCPKLIFLIACGSEGISTPKMYSLFDETVTYPPYSYTKGKFTGKAENMKKALEKQSKEKIISSMYNCFEEIASSLRPEIGKIKEVITENGCVKAMMSGSGPSVFGIFNTLEGAEKAKEILLSMGIFAFTAV